MISILQFGEARNQRIENRLDAWLIQIFEARGLRLHRAECAVRDEIGFEVPALNGSKGRMRAFWLNVLMKSV